MAARNVLVQTPSTVKITDRTYQFKNDNDQDEYIDLEVRNSRFLDSNCQMLVLSTSGYSNIVETVNQKPSEIVYNPEYFHNSNLSTE